MTRQQNTCDKQQHMRSTETRTCERNLSQKTPELTEPFLPLCCTQELPNCTCTNVFRTNETHARYSFGTNRCRMHGANIESILNETQICPQTWFPSTVLYTRIAKLHMHNCAPNKRYTCAILFCHNFVGSNLDASLMHLRLLPSQRSQGLLLHGNKCCCSHH